MLRKIKTTISIPLDISNKINSCIDKFDRGKPSTRQEFMLQAVEEALRRCYGEFTEDVRKTQTTETNSKFLDKWRERNG